MLGRGQKMQEKERKRKEVRDSRGNTTITGGGAPWWSRCPLQPRSRAAENTTQCWKHGEHIPYSKLKSKLTKKNMLKVMILQRTYNLLCFSKPQNSYQYCCLSWNCRFSTKENSVVSSNSSCFFGPQLRLMPGTSISDVKCLTLCIGQHIQKVYKDQTAEVHQELTFVIHCYQKDKKYLFDSKKTSPKCETSLKTSLIPKLESGRDLTNHLFIFHSALTSMAAKGTCKQFLTILTRVTSNLRSVQTASRAEQGLLPSPACASR
ncbi:uncharacterized protein [Anser cygnoides]|uniref:uncharacterized protein n=1 Tax=Anser cygnoides TaxID=8845 RepID=UPI0034D227F6